EAQFHFRVAAAGFDVADRTIDVQIRASPRLEVLRSIVRIGQLRVRRFRQGARENADVFQRAQLAVANRAAGSGRRRSGVPTVIVQFIQLRVGHSQAEIRGATMASQAFGAAWIMPELSSLPPRVLILDGKFFLVKDEHAGGKRRQLWHYPSRAECLTCHSRAANFGLGVTDPQLDKLNDYGGDAAPSASASGSTIRDSQLRTLKHIGVFTGTLPKSSDPKLADPYDAAQNLEARARSYLHVNCSVCHVEAGGGNAKMELGF